MYGGRTGEHPPAELGDLAGVPAGHDVRVVPGSSHFLILERAEPFYGEHLDADGDCMAPLADFCGDQAAYHDACPTLEDGASRFPVEECEAWEVVSRRWDFEVHWYFFDADGRLRGVRRVSDGGGFCEFSSEIWYGEKVEGC